MRSWGGGNMRGEAMDGLIIIVVHQQKSAIIEEQYGEYSWSMIRTRYKVNDNLPIYPYCCVIL